MASIMNKVAIIDFVDGTENPVGQEAVEWGVIGDEDPEFTNGSYAFAQKYEHDLDAWRALPTEKKSSLAVVNSAILS